MNSENRRDEKCAILRQLLLQLMPLPGDYSLGIEGLTLFRREEPSVPQGQGCALPHVTLVFQGAERVLCSQGTFLCEACQLRLTRRDALGTGCITAASADRPFIAASLRLDLGLLQGMMKIGNEAGATRMPRGCISVRPADAGLLDAFLRLIRLHEHPARIPVLAELIVQEIHYLLVVSMSHEPKTTGQGWIQDQNSHQTCPES